MNILFISIQISKVGRDSSVGIATRYGLGCPGTESRWGRDFLHPFRPALGPIRSLVQWVPGPSPGVNRPGRGVDQHSIQRRG